MTESAPNFKKFLVLIVVLSIVVLGVIYIPSLAKGGVIKLGPFSLGRRGDFVQTITLENDYKLNQVETVHSEADREKGLSGRKSLSDKQGMLFLFDQNEQVGGFWMKDMLIPIDMIWINCSGKVLGYEDSVKPDSYPKTFPSPSGSQFVLEVKAGLSKEQGIKKGQQLVFSTDPRGGAWLGCGDSPKSKS